MHFLKKILSIILIASAFVACNSRTTLTQLRCEYAIAPDNLDTPAPRFSWEINATQRGQRQTAYQIRVSDNKSDLQNPSRRRWDSGKIASAASTLIPYQGPPLIRNTHYFWQVTIWDANDQPVESPVAEFQTALLAPADWSAQWIGSGPAIEPRHAQGFFMDRKEELPDTVIHDGCSLLLRREISCPDDIKRARVFVTGLGFYEFYLNGAKIGDHVLAPAKTNYREQVLYDTYDVTQQLHKGENALGIHLGNGWFNPYKKWWQPYRMQWFGAKRALLQLHVEYENGTDAIFISDQNWKHAPGPVLFNCIYDGEIYDANAEPTGWNAPGFDDRNWLPVNLVEAPGGALVSHVMPPIKITQEMPPVKIYDPAPGVRVYDLGQNFTGWVRLTVKGTQGTQIRLRFAEDIFPDGRIDVTSNEHARATATYILKGDAPETYEPRFTYFGFKYVEITGEPDLPEIENVTGCVVHSACAQTGEFECGNALVNKIHRATTWSQRSNMLGYPMDCPQRDERLGWFGDAQVTAEEALFNFDLPLFYQNWLSGIRLNQHPQTGDIPIISPRPYIWDEGVEWSSTYLVLTWLYYLHFGDTRILAEHYDPMKRYLHFLDSLATGYILKPGWIGDWGSLVPGWQEGEPVSVPTAFYFWNATILAKIATLLDLQADAAHFTGLAENIRQAYHREFFNPETRQYNDGSQMANAFPLFLGIVPVNLQAEVLNNLITDIVVKNNGHLTTGVLGSKYMIEALSQLQRQDIAWRLVTQTGYPSWSDMVEKYTTMCEFWTLKQSHNHVMTGSIDAFFFKYLAGIQVDERYPGFQRVIIRPFVPDSLAFARATIQTVRGKITSGWEQTATEWRLTVKIPANVSAEVSVPAADPAQVFENGVLADKSQGVRFLRAVAGRAVYLVDSGEYVFEVRR